MAIRQVKIQDGTVHELVPNYILPRGSSSDSQIVFCTKSEYDNSTNFPNKGTDNNIYFIKD